MSKKYFIVSKGQKEGPYTVDELSRIEISSSTLVWSNDLTDWTEARNVPDLKNLLKNIPPPIPPKKKKSPLKNVKNEQNQKTIFPYIIIPIIIGVFSLLSFYIYIYDVDKYDNYKVGSYPNSSSTTNYYNVSASDFSDCVLNFFPDQMPSMINIRRKCLTKKSINNSILIFIISLLISFTIRHLSGVENSHDGIIEKNI